MLLAARRPLSLVLSTLVAAAAMLAALVVTPGTASAVSATVGQRAVQIAAAQKGKPYRYGADGPNAFDCSGLTKYVYAKLGHNLEHNALAQYRETRHIRHSHKRPGDLIFMNVAGGGRRGIDHVGIYAGHHYWWVARHSGTRIQKQWIWTNHYWVGRVR